MKKLQPSTLRYVSDLLKLGYVEFNCDLKDYFGNEIKFGKENIEKYVKKLENHGILISELENDSRDVFNEFEKRDNTYNGNYLGNDFEYAFNGDLYENGIGIITFHLHGDIRGNYGKTYLIKHENLQNLLFGPNCYIQLKKENGEIENFDASGGRDVFEFSNEEGTYVGKELNDLLNDLSY